LRCPTTLNATVAGSFSRQAIPSELQSVNAARIYSYVHKLYDELDAASVVLSPAMMELLEQTTHHSDDAPGEDPKSS